MHLSERVLKGSIRYGLPISGDKNRFMALGTYYNNLAGSLYGLKKFEEAEGVIITTLKYWQQYEGIAATGEFEVVWDHFGIGDVYEHRAKYLEENGKDPTSKAKKLSI